MVNMWIRIIAAVLGIGAAILGVTSYYAEVIVCLKQVKEVADNSIPTLLAIWGVYQIVDTMARKN
jgi:hypothetical protein